MHKPPTSHRIDYSGSRPNAGGHLRVNGQGSAWGCSVAWTSGPRLRRHAAELRATPGGIAHVPWSAFDIAPTVQCLYPTAKFLGCPPALGRVPEQLPPEMKFPVARPPARTSGRRHGSMPPSRNPSIHEGPPCRTAVCVPFAPLASFALNGSADFDEFALAQNPSATSQNAQFTGCHLSRISK
jgi:hypothetical protein